MSLWLQSTPSNSLDQSLEGSPLDRNVYLGLLVAGLVVVLGRRRAVGRVLGANPAILVFLFYCAISILWSDYPDVAFKRWIKLVSDLTMVAIVLTDPDPSGAIKKLLARVGFILIPLSILLIKYYPYMARYYSLWEGRQFVSGVSLDKNMLGMTCLVFGLAAWWRFLGAYRNAEGRERMRQLIAHGTLVAMAIWLLWMADSITSLSCFIMAGGLMAISLVRLAQKPSIVHLLVVGIVCISFFALFLDSGGSVLQTMGRNPTLTGRTEIWNGLLQMAGNPVFGAGFESFWVGQHLRQIWARGGLFDGINEAHNGYLEVFLNLGWIGVSLLFVLIVTGYRNVVAVIRQDADVGRLRLAFFVVGIVYSLTEAGFRLMCPVWFAFLLAITAVPQVPLGTASSSDHVNDFDDFAGYESQTEPVPCGGFRQGDAKTFQDEPCARKLERLPPSAAWN